MKERRELLGVISHGRMCEIRIERLTYNGRDVVDVRKFLAYAGGAPLPTKLGVRLYVAQGDVSALVEALQKTQAR